MVSYVEKVNEMQASNDLVENPNDEYCTPPEVIKRVKDVCSYIEYDPASNEYAQKYIQAYVAHELKDNSLNVDWLTYSTIWLNPPYSRGNLIKFVNKFTQWANMIPSRHFQLFHGFILTNSCTETEWYQILLKTCDAALLFNKRLSFYLLGQKLTNNRQAQTLFYVGISPRKFMGMFEDMGFVVNLRK